MVISTNQKPTIYPNLYENTAPALVIECDPCPGSHLILFTSIFMYGVVFILLIIFFISLYLFGSNTIW